MIQTKHKKTGLPRTFNDLQWKLLGKAKEDGSKENWLPIVVQETENKAVAQPATGQKDDAKRKLYEERLAQLVAIDRRAEKMDLATMTQQEFDELLDMATKAKAQEEKTLLGQTRLKQLRDIDENAEAGDFGNMSQEEFDAILLAVTTAKESAGAGSEDIEAKKEAFLNMCKENKISKTQIKDYFDKEKQAYENKANADVLAEQLGVYLEWNTERLAENF